MWARMLGRFFRSVVSSLIGDNDKVKADLFANMHTNTCIHV
jgi:hypothetical protein